MPPGASGTRDGGAGESTLSELQTDLDQSLVEYYATSFREQRRSSMPARFVDLARQTEFSLFQRPVEW